MSAKVIPPTKEILRHWISTVNEEGRGLNQWELGFMMSITDQVDRGRALNENQVGVLERIYSEKTP